jgi:hypothetical protein
MDADQTIREAVGLTDPESAIFVKQYGEKRTASNALRALLTQNFTNLFVLMHMLGDKHSAPVDLHALYRAVEQSDNAAWTFTWSATHAVPAETTYPGNYLQVRFVKALHEPVFKAYAEQRFFRVISVRNPYAWAASLLTYQGWPAALKTGTWEHDAAADVLRRACEGFNEKHAAWLAMHEAHPSRSFIVHAERLRHGWDEVLTELEQGMHLQRRCARVGIARSVRPSPWDYVRSIASEEWLDITTPRAVLALSESLHTLVTRQVDWALMAPLGYAPQPFDGAEG